MKFFQKITFFPKESEIFEENIFCRKEEEMLVS